MPDVIPPTAMPRHLPDYQRSAVSYLMLHGATRKEALDVVDSVNPETVRNLHAAHMAEADETVRRVEVEEAWRNLSAEVMRPVERLMDWLTRPTR